MNNFSFLFIQEHMGFITYIIKTFFISIYSYYTFLRIINYKRFINIKLIFVFLNSSLIVILCSILKYHYDTFASNLSLIFLLSILYSFVTNNKLGYTILITLASLSINNILFFIATIISFVINIIINISNDYINLFIMLLIHLLFLQSIFKIPKFKNGFSFFKNNIKSEYFDILILNISITTLFAFIILNNSTLELSEKLIFIIITMTIIMFITIQKTLTMYYKHNLLVSELTSTKAELEEKNKEIAELEAENLNFSKITHSIAHKQKSLEHKLNKLMLNNEFSAELDISNRINNLSKECFTVTTTSTLTKTNIEIIDDMLLYMQSECKENNIEFELQINGNIHHMINNFVTVEELEILLADHIKDAIIAINYSNNINKSILVKLGLFDGEYSLSIYDSGIEFEIPTLISLGIKPITTHLDKGGTGMGFMNTFDTLREHNASLYINEFGKSSKDNYTKSIEIKFNNKNEYIVSSYRINEIKQQNTRDDLIIKVLK